MITYYSNFDFEGMFTLLYIRVCPWCRIYMYLYIWWIRARCHCNWAVQCGKVLKWWKNVEDAAWGFSHWTWVTLQLLALYWSRPWSRCPVVQFQNSNFQSCRCEAQVCVDGGQRKSLTATTARCPRCKLQRKLTYSSFGACSLHRVASRCRSDTHAAVRWFQRTAGWNQAEFHRLTVSWLYLWVRWD